MPPTHILICIALAVIAVVLAFLVTSPKSTPILITLLAIVVFIGGIWLGEFSGASFGQRMLAVAGILLPALAVLVVRLLRGHELNF